jgi:hypothetical protein
LKRNKGILRHETEEDMNRIFAIGNTTNKANKIVDDVRQKRANYTKTTLELRDEKFKRKPTILDRSQQEL